MSYFMSLNPLSLFRAMPGSIAQGMIWGVMALGVYITFRLLDFADLTVDGSIATGGIFALCDGWFGEQTSLFPGNDRIFTGTDRCDVLVLWNRTGTCYPCYGL